MVDWGQTRDTSYDLKARVFFQRRGFGGGFNTCLKAVIVFAEEFGMSMCDTPRVIWSHADVKLLSPKKIEADF